LNKCPFARDCQFFNFPLQSYKLSAFSGFSFLPFGAPGRTASHPLREGALKTSPPESLGRQASYATLNRLVATGSSKVQKGSFLPTLLTHRNKSNQ
jgi:hypothetical protein